MRGEGAADGPVAPTAGLRVADARFLLPRMPRTAVVHLPLWAAGLRAAGVEIADEGHRRPDLVVARHDDADAVRRADAEMALLVGRLARRGPVRNRPGERPYLLLPDAAAPTVALDLSHGRMAARGAAAFVDRATRGAAVKQLTGRTLIRHGLLPTLRPLVTVSAPGSTVPGLVTAATELIGRPDGWYLALPRGRSHKRGVFFVGVGGPRPDLVLKFARQPGSTDKAERETAGLRAAARAGAVVSDRTPRLLGTVEVDGYHAAVQTAVRGAPLHRDLTGPRSRTLAMRRLDAVVRWLGDVATATSRRRTGADPALVAAVRTCGLPADTRAALLRTAASAPAVFAHGDLAEGNVVVGSGGFGVVDLELAHDDGLPLADLVYLLVTSLPLREGARTEAEHVAVLIDLFRGTGRESATLLRWLEATARASGVPRGDVPALVTLALLTAVSARRSLDAARGSAAPTWSPLTKFAERWLADPQLGPSWPLWHRRIGR
jgi:aminoglycoside phosphotransferase (APT) family kinase protein